MKKITFLFVLISLGLNAQILEKIHNSSKVVYYDNTPLKDFFISKSQRLGLNPDIEMKVLYENLDKNNNVHTKYKQFYKGLEVVGGTYFVHSKQGKVMKSTGNLYPQVRGIDIDPSISVTDAIDALRMNISKLLLQDIDNSVVVDIGEIAGDINYEDLGLCIIDKDFPAFSGEYRLAYKINAVNTVFPVDIISYIDANSSELIFSDSKIHNESVPAKGVSNYYGVVDMITDSIAEDVFLLRDNTRGNGIKIYNVLDEDILLSDNDNYWEYSDPLFRSAIDAMYCSEKYYDFLKDKFNRNSIDDNGLELISNVGQKVYVNAFWNGRSATFGGGNCNLYGPLTTLAVVGHEFTHGLTDFTSDLIYSRESGALNESISDIFGESLEYYYDNENFDWLVGTRFVKNGGEAFRSMINPNDLKYPMFYKGIYWEKSFFDRYGVHTNSSVLNHWFYLISDGKKGKNEVNVEFDVKGIGIAHALQIVYQVQTNYLTENSGYNDFYLYSLEAVKDLYGEESQEMKSVKEAWKAVGLPDFSISDDDFAVFLSFNDKDGEKLCWDEIPDIEMKLFNASNFDIPENTELKIELDVETGTEFIDHFAFDTVLNEDLLRNSYLSFYLGLDSLEKYSPSNILITINANITALIDSFSVSNEIRNYIGITDDLNQYVDRSSIIDLESCSDGTYFENFTVRVENFGCRQFDLTDSILIKFVSDNDSFSLVKHSLSFSNSLEFYKVFKYYDFESIYNIDDYHFDVYIKSDTLSDLVFSDTFSKYIYDRLDTNKVLTFEEGLFKPIVKVKRDYRTDTSTVSKALLFDSSDKIEEDVIENCLTYNEYFDYYKDGFFTRNIDKIIFCASFAGLKKPVLKFDLRMFDVNLKDNDNNAFLHLLKVYQGGIPLDTLIYTTKNKRKTIYVPLVKDNGGRISIEFYLKGTKITFDNISIIEAYPASSNDPDGMEMFFVSNPVDNAATIEASDKGIIWTFSLFDINGHKILTKAKNRGNAVIDVSNSPSGVYFYRITNKDTILKTGKLVIVD